MVRDQHAELTRSGDRVILGVCAGLGDRFGIDPVLIRLAFAAATLAGGIGVVAYLLAGLALPGAPADAPPAPHTRPVQQAMGFLTLLGGLAVILERVPGATPPVLLLGGLALILRQTLPATASVRAGGLRVLAGAVLLGGGAVVFVVQQKSITAAASAGIAAAVTAAGVGLLVGPRLSSARAEADAERTERIRADERADVAARLHDSVLQTLALVQSAEDTQAARALARRQERELRAWLYGGEALGSAPMTFAAALRRAADDVEAAYGIEVALVQPSDAPLDPPLEALVAAAREAMTNSGKHAGVTEVSVLARVTDREASVFVRDRGAGFDRATVPADRRGLRDSIEERMERHGGRATIHAAPGEGTEVELALPRT